MLKKVTGTETLSCTSCKHWVHKKCIGQFKDRSEYQTFLKYYFSKEWECTTCCSKQLPFIFMDNNEFILLLLDIYAKPTYLNRDNFQKVYHNLNNKEFFNITDTDTDNHRNDKYLNNIDPDINYDCNDTCDYTLNIDNIINCKNELTIMNFNICNIKKNFANFEHLLSGFNCKLHIICLTESWLGDNDNILDINLDGYHPPYYQNRSNNLPCRGVITYIH